MRYSLEDIQVRLKSNDPSDRRVAMVMIGKARIHSMVDSVVATLKYDADEDVRSMAAWSLDLMGNVESIPTLIEALYDPAFSVRSNAGWALVHLGRRYLPQLVMPDVIDVLRDESHPYAREMAYLVLANIHHQDARDAINKYWR